MSDTVATLITAGLTFVAGLLVNRQSRNQFFSSTVSRERMEWVKDMRALCVELCTICDQYNSWISVPPEQKAAFLRDRNGMLLRLNDRADYPVDQELIGLLDKNSFEEVKAGAPDIRRICMSIFKTEWDKVKIEAGNSPFKVRRIEKLQSMMNARKK